MSRVFCKPAKRGSKAWELCPNSPCICHSLYEDSKKALRDAAPDMLDALQYTLALLEEYIIPTWDGRNREGVDLVLQKVRASIAKATGKDIE